MKKNNVRLLSAILALMLVFQAMPAGVFANEIPADELGTAIEEVTEIVETAEFEETENDDAAVAEENIEAEAEEIIEEEVSEENNEVAAEEVIEEETSEENNETAAEEIIEEEVIEENNEAETEEEIAEAAEEETEEASWQSYTLYNYISVNEGKSYISLNTQENGISAPKSAAEFHKENGNLRYDLSTDEYEIAYYDLTSLVYTVNGTSFVEQSVAKEGQPYFIARLDRVEAVAAARFRASDCVKGIESFTSLDGSNITFHRNWYLTLVTPMASNNKLLTGIRLGDGKNGNGDGKYYGIAFTESFKAVDSRLIAFGTKLSADQYEIADYDFTDLTLTYKGKTYAYRPNGPVAGDGEAFHYYTVSFMKLDKLNKSTYGGGYLVENWPAWSLINTNGAAENGFPFKAGYYHRDYQVTLNVADAPTVIEEEPIIEEIAPVEEETIVEEIAPVEEETIVEEIAPVEEETIVEEIAPFEEKRAVAEEIAPVEEETIVEEIAPVEEEPAVEEIATVEEETIVEEISIIEDVEATEEEIAATEEAPAAEIIAATYSVPSANTVTAVEQETETVEETVQVNFHQAKPLVQVIEETVLPMAAPEVTKQWSLINLIAMIAVAFISLVMATTFFCNNEDEKENENTAESGQKKWSKFLGLIPAAASITTFALTEDMNTLMVLADNWTTFMVSVLLIDLLLAYLSRGTKKEDNENKEGQYA